MRIGEMAAEAGVNVQTIRFRVQFIRVCQGLGFTLREVRQLIRLHRVTASPGGTMSAQTVGEILSMAEERIRSIEEKIATLAKMREEMLSVVRALSSATAAQCPAGRVERSAKTTRSAN